MKAMQGRAKLSVREHQAGCSDQDLSEPLHGFIKRKVGINACAERFAQRLGRPAPIRPKRLLLCD